MKLLLHALFTVCAAAQVTVVNHHPFPIRQPVVLGDLAFLADLGAGETKTVTSAASPARLSGAPEAGGLRLTFDGRDAGRLSWDLALAPAADRIDHVAGFRPLALEFRHAAPQPLYTDFEGSGERGGLAVTVGVRVWHAGFLDTRFALRNVSAREAYGMYAAGVERWQTPGIRARELVYDNRPGELDANGATRFSAGEGRHWSLQHGLDWMTLGFPSSAALVLNSYSESPTVIDDVHSARNKSPRFAGANIPQFKNEARVVQDALYLITEFVRDNRPYRDRFVENRLPERGQTLASERRFAFLPAMPAREEADRAYVAYNSYMSRRGSHVEIGVPSITFGTSYFPYSTLGENFGELKLPGQQTDAFWPLSADTVTRWRDFAGDIRRDLRIAKAMGFTVIRLHYLDVIAKLPEAVQFEYLDFLFGELRQLKLRALFGTAFTYWSPEQIAARVARYKDVIDRLEIENEVLIWGIPLDRPQYWARIYEAVKRAAPNVQIHWTSHLNTGIFNRMDDLRVKCDVVSAHCYIDALDAIPSGRGFALAVGQYARRAGKPAIYTEWNWRGLTRMTPEARAAVYPPIMENLLATRSISELYQFQFQQTMCVNPHTRKGIRQYEPLWLSRRPKPEAFELMKLMDRYAAPETPNRQIGIGHEVVELKDGRGAGVFRLKNNTARSMRLLAGMEASPGIAARAAVVSIELAPHGTAQVPFTLAAAPDAKPGFYHVFLRLEREDGLLRYGWAEARLAGQPEGARWNLDRPVAVVYGQDCPIIELETAHMLAQTVESASGRPVGIYSEQDLPRDARVAVITVGAARPRPGALAIKNFDEGVDFTLAFWMHAKDSAARRIGLVKKQVPAGADVANLP